MSKPASVKVNVVVEPRASGPDRKRSMDDKTGAYGHYEVVETTNTTEPFVGEILSKAQVDALIRKHVTVKVRRMR